MNTALWRMSEANRGTQNTLAETMGQSIGADETKRGWTRPAVTTMIPKVVSLHFVEPLLPVGVEG